MGQFGPEPNSLSKTLISTPVLCNPMDYFNQEYIVNIGALFSYNELLQVASFLQQQMVCE